MKKLPLVSVIINTFNGEKFLRKSILSATKQTYKNLEIIIFDNKSKDKTLSIVKSIKDKTTIIIVSHEKDYFDLSDNIYELINNKFIKNK